MELRNLQATDLFLMVKIINKIGINNIKEAINIEGVKSALKSNGDNEVIARDIGVDIVMSVMAVVLQHLPVIENDLYAFVGGIADMKAKDVAKMELGEFTDLLISIVKKEDFKDFFKRASKLVK